MLSKVFTSTKEGSANVKHGDGWSTCQTVVIVVTLVVLSVLSVSLEGVMHMVSALSIHLTAYIAIEVGRQAEDRIVFTNHTQEQCLACDLF